MDFGKFDNAQIIERRYDWRYPWAGPIGTTRFRLVQIVHTGEFYEAQVEDEVKRAMRQRIGDLHTRNCRRELGEAATNDGFGCSIALGDYTKESLTVKELPATFLPAAPEQNRFRFATSTVSSVGLRLFTGNESQYFQLGKITWTSGNNVGHVSEVKRFVRNDTETAGGLGGDDSWLLMESTPRAIQIGDTFDAIAGCDKVLDTCIDKFDNAQDYNGMLYMPGTNTILRIPTELLRD